MEVSNGPMDECRRLKLLFLAALETCSIKDAEISKLKENVLEIMQDVDVHSKLLTAHIRQRANRKMMELLRHQVDLEMVMILEEL